MANQTPRGATSTAAKHHESFHWNDVSTTRADGVTLANLFLGADADDGPPVRIARVCFPPNYEVRAHTHAADYVELILEGSQQVTRRWYHAGDVRMVKGGTAYGPLIAGPDGVTVLVIFRGDSTLLELPRTISEAREAAAATSD